ncbi:DUF4892 domain-containing protein [Bermanella marisrubri]|uniref:DUF4892 domain-containing protein n=1 Tax=Bermanella marisrubri TaxID=207949 RepID=Q1N6H2_9GAMM|nr:DUF4892 domain-containing protein [Bermanella marisrubri]EAT13620.1 hypothetical protein RED65_09519 [Oceanobacter sp. RED65] [Bermanella marisrubri]QIZ84406.1 DUF4892 domain-containing protein [Bermanella marisrubri]
MMKIRLLTIVLLSVFCLQSHGFQLNPQEGAERIDFDATRKQNQWVVLGQLKRIQGNLIAEQDVRVDGRVTSWMWKWPSGLSVQAAFNYIVEQAKPSSTTLFECEARGCGMSNDFANQVFSQPLLYGRDNDQLYWVGYNPDAGFGRIWLVYTNERTNKGVHLFAQRIDLERGQKDRLKPFLTQGQYQTLFSQKYLILQTLTPGKARLSEENVQWLKELLQAHPIKRFAIVVHRYAEGDPQSLLDRTIDEAGDLRKQLADAGGFVKNVYSHGAGSHLPRSGQSSRIELVELSGK